MQAKINKTFEFSEIDGLNIRYKKKGRGKPLFMFHGWGGSSDSFDALTEHIDTKKHIVLAVDFPGFGGSDKPKKNWTVKDYSDFLGKFVQKMYTKHGLKGGYDVVVHSFGGRVMIMNSSSSKKQKLDKLVLIGAAGIKHPRTFKKRILQSVAKLGGGFLSIPGLKMFKKPAQKLMYKILRVHDYENTSGVMRKTFLNVIDQDLSGLLEHINCPTLILWGKNDTYVPISDAYMMHDKIKNSTLKIIADGRHGIHKTHAKKIGKWINEFLSVKV